MGAIAKLGSWFLLMIISDAVISGINLRMRFQMTAALVAA